MKLRSLLSCLHYSHLHSINVGIYVSVQVDELKAQIQNAELKSHSAQCVGQSNHHEEIEVLQNQISTLQEQNSTLASILTVEEDKAKNMEEEKLVLTQQVKAYRRQCEELKKTMVQLQEKSKTLEEQVYLKERIATEVHIMCITN